MYRHAQMPASTAVWPHASTRGTMSGLAYTPVVAQRSLTSNTESAQAHPYGTPPPPHLENSKSESARQKKMDFPPHLRSYVQRSFGADVQVPGIEKEEVEQMLKQVINDAAQRDQLQTIQWEVFPLPQEIIKKQRAQLFGIAPKSSLAEKQSSSELQSTLAANKSNTSPNNKKRKSEDHSSTAAEDEKLPPWRRNAPRNALEDRVSYANQEQVDRMEKRLRRFQDSPAKSTKSQTDYDIRKQRFANAKGSSDSPWSSREESPEEPKGPVVGTCQNLEKKYFRLTSPPKPETVRPLSILEKTLTHLISKWKKEHNYNFICDQFKSLRQDLTVQHIKNNFTVKVYEIHARIALEQGDLGEYNQCQTQLRALYSQKLGGNAGEFLAYRILYLIHTCNRSDMNDVLADLTEADKSDEAVAYALAVRSALALGNHHRFFKLYLDAPGMGAYLMDKFVDRERLSALANICKAYKPDVPLRYITEELGFESDRECAQFLCDQNGQELLQEKDGVVRFLSGKAGNLFENARSAAFRKVDIKGQI